MRQPPSPYPYLESKAGQIGRITLIGAPLDRTGSFRPGTAEGPSGLRWASENLETYSPELDKDLTDLFVGDLGDLNFDTLTQEEALDSIEVAASELLDSNTIPFFIGGEHSIALPISRAVCKKHPDAMILHFDAHADLREEYLGEKLSHASWAFHVGTEYGFDKLVQLGIRSGTREEFQIGRAKSRHFTMGLDIPLAVRDELHSRPVYISLDLDVLDSSQAPGTGTPEAGGCTYRELHNLLMSLAGMNVICMDINEIAPPLDPTGATSAIAAKLSREMMLIFG
jgi:agmatinase